jgi:F-type H+-transporting ATPase subunit b
LAINPRAKMGLLLVGILYVITVAVLIIQFLNAAEPKDPAATDARTAQKINEVIYDLRGDTSVGADNAILTDDPRHVRNTDLTTEEAAEIRTKYFAPKGRIIGVDATLVLQVLNFAVLLLLLYGFLWGPILSFLDERREQIQQDIDGAAEERAKAGEAHRGHRDALNKLRHERADILDQARSMGEQEGDQIVEHARREAQRITERGHERADEQMRAARDALRAEVAELATEIAAQLIGRELNAADHDAIVADTISRMAPPETETGADT